MSFGHVALNEHPDGIHLWVLLRYACLVSIFKPVALVSIVGLSCLSDQSILDVVVVLDALVAF